MTFRDYLPDMEPRAFKTARDFFEKGSRLIDPAEKLLKGLITAGSHADKLNYVAGAFGLATGMQTAAVISIAYGASQGIAILGDMSRDLRAIRVNTDARSALDAREFANNVWTILTNAISTGGRETWYLIYNPDTLWRHFFAERLLREGPLTRQFLGIWDDLDEMVRMMQSIRREDRNSKENRCLQFDVLMPTVVPILIKEPLAFPDSIRPFRLCSDIHNRQNMVTMNLPNEDKKNHSYVQLLPPKDPGLVSWLFGEHL
ncbi:hypothetical protein BJY04DRAFT_199241 [Aspergillus karnatakaensis]|uniref:uncharacterized protein n=1 Tax=Aspergillus karnatakaensis TaxID=1810916 RepID=UPI003CCCBDBE